MRKIVKTTTCAVLVMVIMFGLAVPVVAGNVRVTVTTRNGDDVRVNVTHNRDVEVSLTVTVNGTQIVVAEPYNNNIGNTIESTQPPRPPITQPQNDTATFEQTMFQLVNEERARHGLQPFINNPALATVAREHSRDMYVNNMMGHTGSNGSTVGGRLTAAGISWLSWAENVAMNRGTAEQVLQQWLNSPGHRANILSNNTYIGIGRYGNIATQKFMSN
ncbi:MAG: CAP domain-containing protein [Defluviitaleaceae bacterium]|nr:CAP domain-containing protein [Defluviitaleaceae bacterium]